MKDTLTPKERLLIYKKALQNLKDKVFTDNGLCWLLQHTRKTLSIDLTACFDEYATSESAYDEYALFFDNGGAYLPKVPHVDFWNVRQTILELCIAMVETEID